MKIVFIYKGRYFLQDAVVIEILSALAKRYGHETALVYDQDVFGPSDNVISSPWLHGLCAHSKSFIKEICATGSDLIVFYDPIRLNASWGRSLLDQINLTGIGGKTVYLSCLDAPDTGGYSFTLIGEPELTFDVFLRESLYSGNQTVLRDPRLADLNGLPFPDKDLFKNYINFRDSYLVFTGKGCPARCSYCMETVLKDHMGADYVRRRSPGHVIAELSEAKRRYGITEIIYKDSIFASNKDWLREYLPLYRAQINLPYKCFAKAGNFDEEIAVSLKESRCYCVEFGVQTFNEPIKAVVLDREESVASLQKAFAMCDRLHLAYDADHLFGIPGESLDDHVMASRIYAGLQWLNRIKCHNLVFYQGARISKYCPDAAKKSMCGQADFFSFVAGGPDMKRVNVCFQKYFKVLPLLPGVVNAFLQTHNRWKIFRFIPNGLIMGMMLVIAVKNSDKRFGIYVKYYVMKLIKTILGKQCKNTC